MDRLSSIDASFLAQERDGSHMHIGGVMVFEGPAPGRGLEADLEARLHLVPRYRQKLSFPRFEMGRPLWVDDPSFNLGYHVRHTALPAPGSVEQLRLLVGRIFSQRLDRSKPLWELWIVEGFESDKFVMVNKNPPRAGGRSVGGRPDHRALRHGEGGHGRRPARPRLEPRARAQRRRPCGEGRRRAGRYPVRARPPGARRRGAPGQDRGRRARGGRRGWRGALGER